MFEPNKTAAMDALRTFLPRAGRDYASSRNYDLGPDRRGNVSMLSPWARIRLLPEWTIVREVRQHHSDQAASKFIDEVCWRTYWKGWLQQHPQVWDDYLDELATERKTYESHLGYEKALTGKSGIECFDAWSRELVETGYLHNHARMWCASIWVHTLRLPWVLGADFFLKHLYDGDAASNTLSWRWVAGLHTRGKSYLARADNISKYTDARFQPKEPLASEPIDWVDSFPQPEKRPIRELAPLPQTGRLGLLVHDDDLSAVEWLGQRIQSTTTNGFFSASTYKTHGVAQSVIDFRQACLQSVLPDSAELCLNVEAVVQWANSHQLDAVALAEPMVGLMNPCWKALGEQLAAEGIALHYARHLWDEHFHPKAGSGFFKLKKAIPGALEQL